MPELPLQDLAILVLEDEILIAMDIEEACRSAGARAVTIMSRMQGPDDPVIVDGHDAAVLDLRLGGESTLPVARRLTERGVPFVFATGYASADRDLAEFANIPVVSKPFAADELVETLAGVVRQALRA